LKAKNLEAVTAVQDVHSGTLLSFAASDPLRLDVTSPVLPLSTVKLMVAVCWWDHESAQDKDLAESEHLLTDMIVYGGDAAGRQMASALRLKIGMAEVLNNSNIMDFHRSSLRRLTIRTKRSELALRRDGTTGSYPPNPTIR
jgi:hypothetical protein